MNNLKQIYNNISSYYARERPLWSEMRKWAVDVKSRDLVLDVGCGEGRLVQDLGELVNYTGVDFSEKLIEIAKTRYRGKKRKFLTGNIAKNDVWENLGKFDKIFIVAVLHHFPTKKEQLYILKQAKKHLKDKGKIYISFWNLSRWRYWKEHLKSLPLKIRSLPEGIRWVNIPFRKTKIKRFYFAGNSKYWQKLLKQAGWEDVKVKLDSGGRNMWAILD